MALEEKLADFLQRSAHPILFAGAGVSARAGIPTWSSYLNQLAELVRPHDQLTFHQISERVTRGDLLKAASYYFLANNITDGDKLKWLARPLSGGNTAQVRPLVSLPFKSIVTTNYDRVLHNAFAAAKNTSAIQLDLFDPILATAPFRDDFFIARLHGKTEDPRTMILSAEHYETLADQHGYLSTLRDIFAFKQVLFVGFSFFDPAIRKILELVNTTYGPLTKGRHLALLPDGIENDFVQRLNRLNIEFVTYDPASHHDALWKAIDATGHALNSGAIVVSPPKTPAEPMLLAKRYIASCYARTQLGDEVLPLRLAVIEGMVCHVIQKSESEGATKADIVQSLRAELQVKEADVIRVVDESLKRLRTQGICALQAGGTRPDRYFWSAPKRPEAAFDDAINLLVDGTVNRFVVRERGHDTSDVRRALTEFFRALVIRRGWDLGAAFAARTPPDHPAIEKLLWSVSTFLSPDQVEKLILVCNELIRSPSAREASVMTDLGRASFALELAIQAPQDAVFHQATLPQRLYLDANVLMPALTYGHTYYTIYRKALADLTAAAKKASTTVSVLTLPGFLNEVVTHRQRALEEFADMGEKAKDMLVAEVELYGSVNLNVFLGAYANALIVEGSDITFPDFLKKYAPYETESQLKRWLAPLGISLAASRGRASSDSIYGQVYHLLEVAFADDLAAGRRFPITLEHDAVQLTALDEDRTSGIRSVFITADRRLREHLSGTKFASLGSLFISHVGLAQLIDLLVGLPGGMRTMQSLLWPAPPSSEFELVRNRLIDLGLREFDAALAMDMTTVVDRIAGEAVAAAQRQNIDLFRETNFGRNRAVRFLDGVENGFYQGVREEFEKRERQKRP